MPGPAARRPEPCVSTTAQYRGPAPGRGILPLRTPRMVRSGPPLRPVPCDQVSARRATMGAAVSIESLNNALRRQPEKTVGDLDEIRTRDVRALEDLRKGSL